MKSPRPAMLLLLIIFLLLDRAAAAGDFVAGIGTHITSEQGLDLISAAGILSLRDDIHWDEVEREKGRLAMPERYEHYVAEALKRHIKPVLILCYGNKFYDRGDFPASGEAREAFARFAEFVAGHFKGRVQLYEVWNEWNYGIGLPSGIHAGDPAGYVDLLKKVYPRIKAVDPAITVLGGAMSGNGVSKGWFEVACKAGLLDSLDALSYHPYCWRATGVDRTPEMGVMKLVAANFEIAQRYRRDVPVYLTEVGWPTHQGDKSATQDEAAMFLARTFLLARTFPAIKGVWWYDFRDDGRGPDPVDPEHNFGIVANDLTPKPAYAAMQQICSLFNTAQFVGEIPTGPGAHILNFRTQAGKVLFAVWSDDPANHEITFESRARQMPGPARLSYLGNADDIRAWGPWEGVWYLRVKASPVPCLIDTGLEAVQLPTPNQK